ncbi:MAG: hypothetical protein EHM49_00440 [Deltaproteobacteria bacterium]|nr:MAG: hypothetical protein EHM49_00440 [Deltaproteobacteria bacterium]
MTIKISSAKAKSRRLQQWVCSKVSDLTGISWGKDEQIASREMGQSGVDVRLIGDALGAFPWSVECKYQETWCIPDWIQQAKDNRKPGTDWLLVVRKNRHEEVVIIDADVFFDLLKLIPYSKKGR